MASPETEAASQPPASEPPSRRRGGLGALMFRAPEDDLQPRVTDEELEALPTGEESSDRPPLDDSPSASEWSSDEPAEPAPNDTTSSPESSGSGGPLRPLGKAALKATTYKGVIIAGEMAHRLGARSELEKLNGLYRTDEQDAENIGDPLASFMSRRGGVVGGKMSPDANDAISALMGLAGYVSKQIALQVALRKYEADVAAGVAPPPGAAADGAA